MGQGESGGAEGVGRPGCLAESVRGGAAADKEGWPRLSGLLSVLAVVRVRLRHSTTTPDLPTPLFAPELSFACGGTFLIDAHEKKPQAGRLSAE